MAERAGRVTHPTGGEVITKQADLAGSDINKIMAKWIAHGTPPPIGGRPLYGDFTGVTDFHTAMNRVKAAEADFLALPSAIRKACDHDPGVFLEKMQDREAVREFLELGLDGKRVPPKAAEPAPKEPAPKAALQPTPPDVPAEGAA